MKAQDITLDNFAVQKLGPARYDSSLIKHSQPLMTDDHCMTDPCHTEDIHY